jgi:hypothetical protein
MDSKEWQALEDKLRARMRELEEASAAISRRRTAKFTCPQPKFTTALNGLSPINSLAWSWRRLIAI